MSDDVRAPAWEDLVEGMTESFPFTVSTADMAAFATLSGDVNPLHMDQSFAREQGFDGPVVYGGLIVAQISRLIGMRLPGRGSMWIGLDIQFRNPLMVDQEAVLAATLKTKSDATRMLDLAFRIEAGDTVIAIGRAQILVF